MASLSTGDGSYFLRRSHHGLPTKPAPTTPPAATNASTTKVLKSDLSVMA